MLTNPMGCAAMFVAYGAIAVGALWLTGVPGMPEVLANGLTLLAAPLLILAMPFRPLLRRMNLVVTAYWSFPKVEGLVLVICFWAVMIVLGGWLLRAVRTAGAPH